MHEIAAVDYPDQEVLSQRLLQIYTYALEPACLFEMDYCLHVMHLLLLSLPGLIKY